MSEWRGGTPDWERQARIGSQEARHPLWSWRPVVAMTDREMQVHKDQIERNNDCIAEAKEEIARREGANQVRRDKMSQSRYLPDKEWLHGWPRHGSDVYMGMTSLCAGCGLFQGTFSIAISDDDVWPDQDPEWPFPKPTCPVHRRYPRSEPSPTAAERVAHRGPLP